MFLTWADQRPGMDPGDGATDPVASARAYYRALDEHDYGALSTLLAPGFVQERPDTTLEGRERFVRFMREERPQTETTHAVDAVYVAGDDRPAPDGPGHADDAAAGEEIEAVAVRGRLLGADGGPIAGFVDVFSIGPDGVVRLDTYTR